MKKLFAFLMILVLVFSCAKEEAVDSHFTPPKWIQGTWEHDGDPQWEFIKDDVISLTANVRQSQKSLYKEKWMFDVVSTWNEYSYTLKVQDAEQRYHFVRKSKNKLEYSLSSQGEVFGTLILKKR